MAALVRAGFTVSVHGLGDPAAGPAGAAVVAEPRGGTLQRLIRALTWPLRARADVLLTIDPDTSLAAFLATRLPRRRWVADVHEDYQALLRDRSWVPPLLLRALQAAVGGLNLLIARADVVLVADDHVPPRRARRRIIMRNEPDFSLLPALRDVRPEGPWRAVYVGDNRTSRGLRTMVEAVAGTASDDAPWRLDIVGPVAAADRDWLDARLAQPDALHITAHGRQDPKRSWEIVDGADVGLCLLADTPAFRDAMPSKVYEYLACAMPTIASPLPRVMELLHRTGAGVVVDGPAETTRALRRFAGDATWRGLLVDAARETAEVARARRSTYDAAAEAILGVA